MENNCPLNIITGTNTSKLANFNSYLLFLFVSFALCYCLLSFLFLENSVMELKEPSDLFSISKHSARKKGFLEYLFYKMPVVEFCTYFYTYTHTLLLLKNLNMKINRNRNSIFIPIYLKFSYVFI